MNTKVLLAALAGGIAAFLLGWVIFGMLLTGYYDANMIHYEGLMKPQAEMNLGLMFVSNLMMSSALAYALHRMGVSTLLGGVIAGAIIGFLFYLSVDLAFMSMMNMFSNSAMVLVDVFANTVWAACVGGVVGLMLGRGTKAVAG